MNKLLFSALALIAFISAAAQQVHDLRCEHLDNPVGVDAPKPRFSWMLPDGVKAQTGWSVLVGTDSAAVARMEGKWFSGHSPSVMGFYSGERLKPCTRYWWRVRVNTDDGRLLDSPVARFDTGKMGNWEGWWIYDTKDLELRPAAAFRKDFQIRGDIAGATVYIAAAGLCEISINGKKVGDGRLEPAFTRFDRRVLYLSHDVTSLLREGVNTIGVLMGNGWYNHQAMAVWDYETAPWRHRPCFCLDLRIDYADGSAQTVITDKTWKTHLSEVTYNNIYVAEQVDGRQAQPGWDSPGFDDSSWSGVKLTVAPSEKIVSQQMRPIRDVDTLRAVNVRKLSDREYLYDFGQNISGVTELVISGEAGTTFRLRHGEFLRDGRVSTENIDYFYTSPTGRDEPFATDIFTLGGRGEEHFRQRFGYKGFRFVEVSADRPVIMDEDNLSAYFVHSDIPVRGRISSSNAVLNWIWRASCYSYLSNLAGYPTDCPQREKNGWTGDTNMAMDIGFYNFDPITVYAKWMEDHKDAQLPNGVFPNIIPSPGWGYDWGNGPDWTSTNIVIPWRCYLFYGDDTLLRGMYDNMKAYIGYIRRTWPGGLTDWGLGDWLPVKSTSTLELTSSVFYYDDVRTLAKIAALTGHDADAADFRALANIIRERINGKYFDKARGVYANGTQTEMAMPLYWDVVPEEDRQRVADNLAADVAARGLDVGLLGSKAILGALSSNGHLDLAFRMATSTEHPSWGYWMKNGATTFYENWHIERVRDLSMNHMMYGEINAWFYKALGGITPDELHPGFAEFNVRPGIPASLASFEAVHICPYGEIRSGWTSKGRVVTYTLTVPSNTIAHLTLPDGRQFDLHCGTYSYKLRR